MSAQDPGPLLTAEVHAALLAARERGAAVLACSLDLGCTSTTVEVGQERWNWRQREFPYLDRCRRRTVYYWTAAGFQPVARFNGSLIKLVPTDWGPPTFEIDGVKMLPTARISPYVDAGRKVALIQPRGKLILDTCGGLGYFAAWCLRGQAAAVQSFEKNPDVIWLRGINPWSPERDAPLLRGGALTVTQADVAAAIVRIPGASFDAILHDPPRFGLAGELYSQSFYEQLARVIRRRGRLFHYTGAPQKVARGRDLAQEVANRLRLAGFVVSLKGDGILAIRGDRS